MLRLFFIFWVALVSPFDTAVATSARIPNLSEVLEKGPIAQISKVLSGTVENGSEKCLEEEAHYHLKTKEVFRGESVDNVCGAKSLKTGAEYLLIVDYRYRFDPGMRDYVVLPETRVLTNSFEVTSSFLDTRARWIELVGPWGFRRGDIKIHLEKMDHCFDVDETGGLVEECKLLHARSLIKVEDIRRFLKAHPFKAPVH